jgi:hypothetical protein
VLVSVVGLCQVLEKERTESQQDQQMKQAYHLSISVKFKIRNSSISELNYNLLLNVKGFKSINSPNDQHNQQRAQHCNC